MNPGDGELWIERRGCLLYVCVRVCVSGAWFYGVCAMPRLDLIFSSRLERWLLFDSSSSTLSSADRNYGAKKEFTESQLNKWDNVEMCSYHRMFRHTEASVLSRRQELTSRCSFRFSAFSSSSTFSAFSAADL